MDKKTGVVGGCPGGGDGSGQGRWMWEKGDMFNTLNNKRKKFTDGRVYMSMAEPEQCGAAV